MYQEFAPALRSTGRGAALFELTVPTFRQSFVPVIELPDALQIESALSRHLDIAVAALALILLAPVMLTIGLIIRLTSEGPVFFRQQRLGKDGAVFTCLKFRTMHVNSAEMLERLLESSPEARAEWAEDHKLRNDPRIIGIGRILRKTSLDELPQLLNVLSGEMSVVGPRPIIASEAVRYGRYIRHYKAVRPGITGIWQVNGRNNTTYRRRVACDVVYSRTKSPVYNLKLMALTVPAVLLSKGAF